MSEPIHIDDLPTKAEWWPFSPWSTKRLCRIGELEYFKLGRGHYVTRESLEKYIQRNRVKAKAG